MNPKNFKLLVCAAALSFFHTGSIFGGLVYVDAKSGPGGNFSSPAGQFFERTTGPGPKGFSANAYQSNGVPQTATMTMTGLLPNRTYGSARLYYIGKSGTTDWPVGYSYNGVDFTIVDDDAGTWIDNVTAMGTAIVPTGDLDTRGYLNVPDFTTDSSGQFVLTVKSTSDRMVLDGFAYETTPLPPSSFAVTDFVTDRQLQQVTLTWESTDGAVYTVQSSLDLVIWRDETTNFPAASAPADRTTFIDPAPRLTEPKLFYRIARHP